MDVSLERCQDDAERLLSDDVIDAPTQILRPSGNRKGEVDDKMASEWRTRELVNTVFRKPELREHGYHFLSDVRTRIV